MEKIFKLKTFWVTFIAASAAAALAVLNMSGGYVSRAEIMVVPRSIEAIKNSNQIIENLRELPLTLAFYDKVTASDSDLEDDTVRELPDAKRKAYWNSIMSAKRVSDSGILVLEDRSQDMFFADNLNKQAVETFISSIGLYYDIKNNIDVRIVDPTVTQYVRGFDGRLFAEFVAGAFLFGFFGFLDRSLAF